MTYTWFSLVLCIITLGLDLAIFRTKIITQKQTWWVLGIMFILTLIFNSLLTGLPIVTYDEQLLSGIKLGTIPIEDFSYAVVATVLPFSIVRFYERKK